MQQQPVNPVVRAGYLHQLQIRGSKDLPLRDQQRKLTDVCCLILGILFGVIIFILACVFYNSANLQRTSYPADSNGKVCMLDTNTGVNNYPFLFFNDLTNPANDRHCVAECPEAGVATKCYDNCTITYYSNYPSSNNLGSFCLPNDPTTKDQLLLNAGIANRFNNIKAVDYLLAGVGISFGLSIIWLLLVQFFPKAMYWVALLLALFLLFVAMLVFFIGSGNTLVQGQGWAIILGIVCIALWVVLLLYSCYHRKQIYLTGCFLEIAGTYLRQHWSTLIWVPIFIGITFLFGLLVVFQYLAFVSKGTPYLQSGAVYYSNVSNWFGNAVLVIQTLWGLSFWRDCFNYIISGLSCEWYFKRETSWYTPLRRLFCKNIGSVAGGSFLSSLFFIPSIIISIFFPHADCCLCNFFDLARSDVYTWIYLSGNSYCASSRQNQYLCRRSAICKQNQSVISVYTFIARVVLAFAGILIVYWIARDNLVQSQVPPYLLLGIFFQCLYVTCYCSDLHSIVAQAFLVCFLAEYDLEEGWTYKQMGFCPDRLRQLVTDIDNKTEYGYPVPRF